MGKRRSIRVEGDVAYVPLTMGYEAIIDAADVPLVEGRNWAASVRRHSTGEVRCVYAVRFGHVRDDGTRPTVYLHRLIAGVPDDMDVDHIDGNGLNNRRSGPSGNLRLASRAQNIQNKRQMVTRPTASGLKGVVWCRRIKRWRAYIAAFGQRKCLGSFVSKHDAADAYARASKEMHGEFGRLK